MFDDLKGFYSPFTNAYSIIKRKLLSMAKYPSASRANELEGLGFTIDYDPKDHGEEPIRSHYPSAPELGDNEPY